MPVYEPMEALRGNRAVMEGYLNLGLQLLEWEQPEAALSPLEKFLQAQPRDASALAAKAKSLAQLKRHAEALACVDLGRQSLGEMAELEVKALGQRRGQRMVRAASQDVSLLELRGDIQMGSGNHEEALAAYRQALQELQELPEEGMGEGEAELSKERLEKKLGLGGPEQGPAPQ